MPVACHLTRKHNYEFKQRAMALPALEKLKAKAFKPHVQSAMVFGASDIAEP